MEIFIWMIYHMMCNSLCKRFTVSFSLHLYCDIYVNSFILGSICYYYLISLQILSCFKQNIYQYSEMYIFKKISHYIMAREHMAGYTFT